MQSISFVDIGIILITIGIIVLAIAQAWLFVQIKKLKDDWKNKK